MDEFHLFDDWDTFTLVIIGLWTNSSSSLESVILQDNNTIPYNNEARVRFVNAVTGSSPMTLAADGTDLFSEIAYGNSSNYVTITPKNYKIQLIDSSSRSLLSSSIVDIGGAAVYTIIAEVQFQQQNFN